MFWKKMNNIDWERLLLAIIFCVAVIFCLLEPMWDVL